MGKSILVCSLILNFALGIVVARNMGEIAAFKEVNNIYRTAACEDQAAFRRTLEAFDVNALFEKESIGAKISPEQKSEWVEKQLSSCFPFESGSAEAARRLAIMAMVEQFGFTENGKNYFSFPEIINKDTAQLTVILDTRTCELQLTTDGAKPPYGWLINRQSCSVNE